MVACRLVNNIIANILSLIPSVVIGLDHLANNEFFYSRNCWRFGVRVIAQSVSDERQVGRGRALDLLLVAVVPRGRGVRELRGGPQPQEHNSQSHSPR